MTRIGSPRARTALSLAAAVAVLALAGCGRDEGAGLADVLRSTGGVSSPDEFLILPTRPLEMPDSLTALPEPTPGAPNRVDIQPLPEASAALTGRPSPNPGATGSEGAVLAAAQARSGGIDPQIRQTLAAEDAAFRRDNRGRFLERLFGTNTGQRAYRTVRLDDVAEWRRLRDLGVRVPPAPPPASN